VTRRGGSAAERVDRRARSVASSRVSGAASDVEKGITVGNQTGKGAAKSDGPVVGGHTDAYCGKCKSVTSHIVLAKVGVKPTRVECRTCHAMHAFKASASSSASSGRSSSGRASAKAAEANPEEVWASSMRHARGEAIKYVPSGQYQVGNRLQHARFGEGVVMRLASNTVCEVVFKTGTVKLIMGASSTGRASH
jgi:hypothetical protein